MIPCLFWAFLLWELGVVFLGRQACFPGGWGHPRACGPGDLGSASPFIVLGFGVC